MNFKPYVLLVSITLKLTGCIYVEDHEMLRRYSKIKGSRADYVQYIIMYTYVDKHRILASYSYRYICIASLGNHN